MLKQTMKLVLLPAAAAVLVACGGGGGGVPGSVATSIMGTAATGAPIANAKVYIVDSLGRTPAGQDESAGTALVTTDANGQYALTSAMLNGLTGPFMVRIVGQMLTESGDMGPAVLHAGVGAGLDSVACQPPVLVRTVPAPGSPASAADPLDALLGDLRAGL